MKNLIYGALIFGLSFALYGSCDPNEKHDAPPEVVEKATYGESFDLNTVTSLDNILGDFESYAGKSVQMKAKVTNVCRTKGCWMALSADVDDEVRVRFKDYGFFVPISLIGKEVIVEGDIQRLLIEKDLAQHFKEDAGATAEEIAAVDGPVYEYTFTARGVRVL